VFDAPLSYAFTDPAAALFLKGMATGLEETSAALSIIPRLPEGPERSAELVRSALVDGYMLFCTAADDPRYTAVRARNLPFVLIEYDDDPTAAHVQIDDIAGAEAAARHLVDLGHRRVAIVSHYQDGVVTGPEAQAQGSSAWRVQSGRLAGWRAGLEAGGIGWGAVHVSGAGGSDAAGGARAAAALLDRADRPTAILALSDLQAIGLLRAAAERGIDVPGELSIAGFDDIPQAAATTPALTTVSQPHEEKGRAAVRLLVGGADPADSVLLPCDLVVRASTGPAPH